MIKLSIRNKIMGIAVTLIALMVVTAIWTVMLVMQVGSRIEEFAYSFVPAYGDLARANIRSLEQGITIRRIIIDKLQSPDDSSQQAALRNRYESLGGQVELEIMAARALIKGLVAKGAAADDIDAQPVREPHRCHQRRYPPSPRRRDQAPGGGARQRRREGAGRGNGARRRTPRRAQQEAGRYSVGYAVAAAPGCQRHDWQAAAGDADLHPVDGACRRPRSGVRRPRQHRRHPPGAAVAGGREGGRGGQSAGNDRRHLARRNRPPDDRVQPDGRAVAAQGAAARNLRQVCRPARRRRVDSRAGPGGRGRAARDDGAVLRRQGIFQHQRRHDAAGAGQGDEPLFLDDVGADPRPSGRHRQIYRRRHHGLLGAALRRRRRTGTAREPGGAGDAAVRAAVTGRTSRAARGSRAAHQLRHPHRHCDRRGAGRQHRFRTDDGYTVWAIP